MKKLSLFFVLLLSVSILKAQDKIITLEGDTINCNILSVGGGRISYEQKKTDGSIAGKSIAAEQVAEYIRTPQPTMSSTGISQVRTSTPKHSWLIGISSGISHLPWMLDNIESYEIPEYYKDAKTGFHINVGTHYMISSFFGAGVEYSFFKSSYDEISQTVIDPHYPTYTNYSEKFRQYMNYVGVSGIFQQHLGKGRKIRISETLSGGGIFYRAEEQAATLVPLYSEYSTITANQLTTGFTWAGKLGLSVEYNILPYLSVGLGGDLFLTWLNEIDVKAKMSNGEIGSMKGVKLEKSMNLSRIDGSLSLRFHF